MSMKNLGMSMKTRCHPEEASARSLPPRGRLDASEGSVARAAPMPAFSRKPAIDRAEGGFR
jgi:hypothetical protein